MNDQVRFVGRVNWPVECLPGAISKVPRASLSVLLTGDRGRSTSVSAENDNLGKRMWVKIISDVNL